MKVSLRPFTFVDRVFDATRGLSPAAALRSFAVLQVLMNIVLFLPLGAFVRRLLGQSHVVAGLAGLQPMQDGVVDCAVPGTSGEARVQRDDLPSGDRSAKWKGPSGIDGEEMQRTPESTAIFAHELRAMIAGLYNHPSIVIWVPFNEGWGQFDNVRILNLTKQLDPTRLVNGASGGNHFPAGDIIDHHQYPGPGLPRRVTNRAIVLGEFGGLGLPLKGHTWQDEKNWGYKSFTNAQDLTRAYVELLEKLHPLTGRDGLSAAIYTQTTDVEIEGNGVKNYDRAAGKMEAERSDTACLYRRQIPESCQLRSAPISIDPFRNLSLIHISEPTRPN